MPKIGVVTLYGYTNYGNRLQNYAVQELLKRYGYETETLVTQKNLKPILKQVLMKFKAISGNVDAKRYLKLKSFSNKYIPIRKIYTRNMEISEKYAKQYDYFVVGSDQVWNPLIRKNERNNFFLKFAEKHQRLCISPSFGVREIPSNEKEAYREGLNGFNNLCSREKEGVTIIKTLTGKEAELLIDPTLALSYDSWSQIFETPPKKDIKKKYVLNAFLGKLPEEQLRQIYSAVEQEELELINVFKDESYSPGELLYMLSNAELICTDSFHFAAFSINFNRPFIVFRREGTFTEENMFSRLMTLLDMFKLQSREYSTLSLNNVMECDFTQSNRILTQERKKFFQYMDRLLK